MSYDHKFTSVVVGYGEGKSRCYFGTALHFLVHTNKRVLVVFANDGLMKKDLQILKDMLDYCR